MKKINHLLFSGLALMLVLSTCTMEKRILTGYHIEWKKGKQNHDRRKLVNKDNGKTTEQHKIATVEQSDNETNTIDNTTTIKDKTITASADDKQIILPQKEKINLILGNKVKTPYEEKTTKAKFKINSTNTIKKSQDGLFLFLGGLLGLLTLGLFKSNSNKARKISHWAKKNPWKTRGAITAIKILLGIGGLLAGKILFDQGVSISESTTHALLWGSIITALFYPVKNAVIKLFKHSYARQKTHDLVLTMSGFLLMASIGNQSAANKEYFPLMTSIYQGIDNSLYMPDYSSNQSSQVENNLKQSQIKQEMVEKKKDTGWETAGKIILSILCVAFFLLLEYLILVLSCSLLCSGQDVLAWAVLIGGTALNFLLVVVLLLSLWKKK